MAPLDTRGEFYDGTPISSAPELANVLLKRPIPLVRNFTERLLSYAIGRPLEYYDSPTVRAITRSAEADDYKISALVLEIVKSDVFQMRQATSHRQLRKGDRAMKFITGKHLSRRTFLRGTGASVALPFMDAMVPAGRAWRDPAAGSTRLVCMMEAMGCAGGNDWGDSQRLFAPAIVGRDFEFETAEPAQAPGGVPGLPDGGQPDGLPDGGAVQGRGDRW